MPRVRVLAPNSHVDLADSIPLAFGDVVDEVELTGLFQKPGVCPDIGEHEAAAAVDVADQVEVLVHLGLVEVLTPLELQIPVQKLTFEPTVANEGDVANGIAGPLVDHEREMGPIPPPLVNNAHFTAHLRLEESEAAIVGSQRVHIAVDRFPVYVAADQPEHARLALDLGQQAGVGGDRVADEARPEGLAGPALVNQKHRAFVAVLAPFDGRHPRGLVALLVVVALDSAAGFLDHVGIHRVADVDLSLLAECAGGDPLVTDVLHVTEHRPLDHLKDHHHPVGDPDVLRVNVDELPRPVQRADVFLDYLRIEDLPSPGHEFGQFRNVGRFIALDPHLHDHVGRRGGRGGSVGVGHRWQRLNGQRILGGNRSAWS